MLFIHQHLYRYTHCHSKYRIIVYKIVYKKSILVKTIKLYIYSSCINSLINYYFTSNIINK